MTLRSPVPGAPPKLRSTNSVPPPQAASSQCKLNLHFIYNAVWNRPHSVLLMFNRGVALNVFCFRFFLWLTFPFGEKKHLCRREGQRSSGEKQSGFSRRWWWWPARSCVVMHFLIWPVLSDRDRSATQSAGVNPGSPDFLAGLAFVLFWKVHRCFCTVLVLLWLQITPEFAKSGHMRRLAWSNFDPIKSICQCSGGSGVHDFLCKLW